VREARNKGKGLGLPTVNGMVKSHDGYFEHRCTLGEGTKADIYLYALVPTAPHSASTPTTNPAEANTILVVDDAELMRTSCSRMLERFGYEVPTASGGADAQSYRQHAEQVSDDPGHHHA